MRDAAKELEGTTMAGQEVVHGLGERELDIHHHGVVWQRGAETLSGIVLHTEILTAADEWLGENLRFATTEEIEANPALRAQVHPGDTVMHYLNRDPEGIEVDGREGFAVVRSKRCVARVVVSA